MLNDKYDYKLKTGHQLAESKLSKNLKTKEQYYVPPQYKSKTLERSDKAKSSDTTKHSSANGREHDNNDSDVYGLNNRKSSKAKKKKKIRNNDTLTQESEDEKQHEIDLQRMTFKKYRQEILNKKKKIKKQIKEKQKELIERKNSSNGSIKGNYLSAYYLDKQSDLDESSRKREKTQKLINRIIENTEKQGKHKSKTSKSSFARDNTKANNLSPENMKERDSGRSNELQRLVSPKPPKPNRIDSSSNILSQSNNSMNISQLLRETNPNNDKSSPNKRSPVRLPDPTNVKIEILKKEEVQNMGKTIDINNIER